MVTQFDTAVFVITLIFATLGVFKGAVRSILGLAKYYGAAVLTMLFYPQVKAQLGDLVSYGLVANGAAIFLTYVGALIILSLLISIVCAAMGSTVGGPIDRVLGIAVGITIGAIIGSTAHLMVRSVSGGQDPEWIKESRTYEYTNKGADILGEYFDDVLQKMGTDFGLAKDLDPSEVANNIIQSSQTPTGEIDMEKLKEAIRMLKLDGMTPDQIKDMISIEDYKIAEELKNDSAIKGIERLKKMDAPLGSDNEE